jgi:hypothetical protein
MQRLATCSATLDYFQFSNLCSVILGIGEVQTADILGSEFPKFYFGECGYESERTKSYHLCEIKFYLFKSVRNLRLIIIFLL